MTNDTQIIEGLKVGNELAFRKIYELHYPLLCYVAQTYVKDKHLAETLVGDVIFHLWEIHETLNITTSLRSYLVTAVRNHCLNHLNLKHNRHEVLSGMLLSDAFPYNSDNGEHPLGILIERELEEKIYSAIARLPEECRCVFEKSRFDGKTYDEIATELGISVNTVKYHVKRALRQLRTDLSSYLPAHLLLFVLGNF